MDENNSLYPSIDTSLSANVSSFSKADGEDAVRRMQRGFIRCPLERTFNNPGTHIPGGFRFFQNLQHKFCAEKLDTDDKDDKESNNAGPASDKRLKFRQSGEFWQTQGDFEQCVDENQGEADEDTSTSSGISYLRQTSDTGSLPDVILSTSSATEASPDLVNLDDDIGEHSESSERLGSNTKVSSPATSGGRDECEATLAKQKFDIEGRVNDPKVQKFHIYRQVSFNKQVSIREIDGLGGIDRDISDKNFDHDVQEVFSLSQENEWAPDNQTTSFRDKASSAEEMRHKYSDRTSGYGTGDSKNSQTGSSGTCSTDQTIFDDLYHSKVLEPNDRPLLSVFGRDFSETSSSGSQSVHTIIVAPGAVTSGSDAGEAPCQAGLPCLSILNDSGSLVMPSLEWTSINSMPHEIKQLLDSSGNEDMGNPSSDFEENAFETLYQFQRSNSTPQKKLLTGPQVSPNGHRVLTKAHTFPFPSKDNMMRMREELISNYSEDLLFNIDHSSPTTAFESVIQKIQDITTGYSDSSSPSPITPLTPKIQQGLSSGFYHEQRQKKFSFHSMQTLVLCAEGKSIQSKMLQASRCRTKRCQVPECKMGKRILSHLDHSMQTALSDVTYANFNLPLIALLDHSLTCDEMRCTLPWCNFLHWQLNLNSPQNSEDIDPRQVAKLLTQFAQLPTLRFTSWEGSDETLYKLNSKFPLKTVTEGIDWIAMVRMGTYGGSVMATTTTTLSHWIIKKVHLTHTEEDSRLEVYRRLRDHGSPNIVSYLWMKQLRKLLHVCYVFEQGVSVHERLQSAGPFSPDLALSYFRQVLDAAMFLHQRDILYLYWTAKNLVLGSSESQATCKLCNFSAAVCLSENYDVEDVQCMVPAILLPMELISGEDRLCSEVDSWGLGCLLTELLTARPARQDLVHEERCVILNRLEYDPIPRKPDIRNDVVDQILTSCWKINPKERMTAARLRVLTNSNS